MGGGLVLVGLSGYAFTIIVGQVFNHPPGGTDRTVAGTGLTNYYFLVISVLLGVFAGLEQATNRRVAHAIARNAPIRPVLVRAGRDAVWLAVCTSAVVLAASPVLVGSTLKGNVGVFSALLIGIPLTAAASLLRGVLAGSQQFGAYAATWAAEGSGRLCLLTVVLVSGTHSPWTYGYAYVVPYAFSGLLGLFLVSRLHGSRLAGSALRAAGTSKTRGPSKTPETSADGSSVSAGLVSLTMAGVLSMAVANLPQLIFGSHNSTDSASAKALALAFGQAFVLARITLIALVPFQSMLLPAFTAAAAVKDFAGLRRRLIVAFAVCVSSGLLWSATVSVAGPWVLHNVYGSHHTPSTAIFIELGVGTALFAGAGALQPALIALGRFSIVPFAWGFGTVVTVVTAYWPGWSAVSGAAAASLAGPLTVTVVMAGSYGVVRKRLTSPEENPELLALESAAV